MEEKIVEGDIVEILENSYTVFGGKSGFVINKSGEWFLIELAEIISWFHEKEIRNITVRCGG